MKRISVIVIAALASLALSASVGAVGASATVLCKVSTSPCPAGQVMPAGSYFTFGAGELKLTNPAGETLKTDIRCGAYSFASQTLAEAESPLTANLVAHFWGPCYSPLNPQTQCTIAPFEGPDVFTRAGGIGIVNVSGLTFSTECVTKGSVQKCTFKASQLAKFGLNNEGGEWLVSTVTPVKMNRIAGALCGESVNLTVEEAVTSENWITGG